MNMRTVLIASALLLPATPRLSPAEDLESPRYQAIALAGVSVFRGGVPSSSVTTAIPFQPDTTARTIAAILSFRAMGKVRVDAEAAVASGRTENGFDAPNNHFFSAGLSYPWLSLRGGRFTSLLVAGGGATERRAQDAFQSDVEKAFEVGRWSPFAYGGAAIEVRASETFGLRADYRYSRIFPDKLALGFVERKSYGSHRVLGGIALSF